MPILCHSLSKLKKKDRFTSPLSPHQYVIKNFFSKHQKDLQISHYSLTKMKISELLSTRHLEEQGGRELTVPIVKAVFLRLHTERARMEYSDGTPRKYLIRSRRHRPVHEDVPVVTERLLAEGARVQEAG